MNKLSKIAGAAAAATLVAISGSAFTGGVTGMPASATVGYGETTVTGATLVSLDYTFNGSGETITNVAFVLAGNVTSTDHTVKFVVNDTTTLTCDGGTYSATTTNTTHTCANLTVSASSLATAAISVVSNTFEKTA